MTEQQKLHNKYTYYEKYNYADDGYTKTSLKNDDSVNADKKNHKVLKKT